MGISTTPPNSQQSTLIFTTTAAVVGVLAGVLLTLGYGEAISAFVEERMVKSRGTGGRDVDGRVGSGGGGDRQRKRGGDREAEGGRSGKGVEGNGKGERGGMEGTRGGVEKKRNVKEGIEGCIGNTPLIRIKSLSEATGCDILAKAEFLNGAGQSPKDRVALSLIDTAEKQGLLTPHSGDTVYEGTVGSTGISLAAICRARGYKAHICMPTDTSPEKHLLLSKLGALVDLVPPAPIIDPAHFVNRARSLAAQHTADPEIRGRGFFADQFETEANWKCHYEGTGREIWEGTGGRVDAFVAGAGTGGTIAGIATYLKGPVPRTGDSHGDGDSKTDLPPRSPTTKIYLSDPPGSGLYNLITHGVLHSSLSNEGSRRRMQSDTLIEGIGLMRLTANFKEALPYMDGAVRVSDEGARRMARWLVERDGIFVGGSSAVNVWAATRVALDGGVRGGGGEEGGREGEGGKEGGGERRLGKGATVVTILCDSGTRGLGRFWKDVEMSEERMDGELGEQEEEMTLEWVMAA